MPVIEYHLSGAVVVYSGSEIHIRCGGGSFACPEKWLTARVCHMLVGSNGRVLKRKKAS